MVNEHTVRVRLRLWSQAIIPPPLQTLQHIPQALPHKVYPLCCHQRLIPYYRLLRLLHHHLGLHQWSTKTE